jgi:glucose-1-phosphate thymidylyltransferase
VPAAGRAIRFGSSSHLKELFPLVLSPDTSTETQPLCTLAFGLIRRTGAERCLVVLSPDRGETLRVLGDGRDTGMALAYVVQPEPRGLPHAVRSAAGWLADDDVVFAMPDTLVLPMDALERVHAHRLTTGASLTLGAFRVDEPEHFGPVDVDADGTVRRVLDKPGHREITTVWGIASWASSFTRFCSRWDLESERDEPRERVLSGAFEAARQAGLGVNALVFEQGTYVDAGTPEGLKKLLALVGERHVSAEIRAGLAEPQLR